MVDEQFSSYYADLVVSLCLFGGWLNLTVKSIVTGFASTELLMFLHSIM